VKRASTLYAAVAVVAAVKLLIDAIPSRIAWALAQGTGDCVINWLGARAFRDGIDIYSPAGLQHYGLTSFGHPPTTPLWYLPFTQFDIYGLHQVIGHLLMAMLLVHCLLIALELRAPAAPATGFLAFAAVAWTTWWQDHLHMVQISEPIAFLYVLAWLAWRRNDDVMTGLSIGLALTLKPYAGVLCLLLILARRWRALVTAIAVYALFAVIASWRFGVVCWKQFLQMIPATQDQWAAHVRNASLQGIVLRWWWPACRPHGGTLPAATALALVLSLALVALTAWLGRRAVREGRIDLPFAAATVLSCFLNPVAWEHYYVTLILPIGISLAALRSARAHGMRPWWIAIGVATVAVVIALLAIDMRAKIRALSGPHLQLHLYEVANWLPWVLMLMLLWSLQWWLERQAGGISESAR
jgi:hypothetical protein